jgi:uncharacterized SAM-binding protein YcdF (DUF218 family)
MTVLLIALIIGLVRAVFLLHDRQPRAWRWWLGWAVPLLAGVIVTVQASTDPQSQKFLGRLAMPLGVLWLGVAVSTVLAALRKHWRMMALLSASLLFFTVSCSSWVGDLLIRRLEAEIPHPLNRELPKLQALFVLGGSTSRGPRGDAYVNHAGDRVLLAARLFQLGKTPLLVASGSGFPGIDADRDLAHETAAIWRELGIPTTAIIELPGPINTRQEIEAYQALCRARGWNEVAIISSAWHLPRALSLCRAADFKVLPIGADWRSDEAAFSVFNIIPSGFGAATVQVACWEWLGILINHWRSTP